MLGLLKETLVLGKELPSKLCEHLMQIMKMCQGLPLIITILAKILANMDQDGWEEVVQGLSPSTILSIEQCKATLKKSYKHLSNHLKPCFLYFGAIPKDYEHTVEELIWLWVAEGFVLKTQFRNSEGLGNDYMIDLVGRNLIIVLKQ